MEPRRVIRDALVGLLTAGLTLSGCDFAPDFEGWKFYDPNATPYVPPPPITAPAIHRAVQGYPDTVKVWTSSGAILTVDLAQLPPENNARFLTPTGETSIVGDVCGQLTWTPTTRDLGEYRVKFTARTSESSASKTTGIFVTDHLVDRPPRVIAPAETTIAVGEALRLHVDAEDPDGDPIFGWALASDHGYPHPYWSFTFDPPEAGATLVYAPAEPDTIVFTFRAYSFVSDTASTRVLTPAPLLPGP